MSQKEINQIITQCEELAFDFNFESVKKFKEKTGGKAIGYMPIYVPKEIIHAAGMLPVGIVGGGDRIEIIRGDAYFQSYICHIPRSTIELGVSGKLDCLDGMLFPSICDVIRNLSGMWQILFPDKYVKYFDVPQNFDSDVGGMFYTHELEQLKNDLEKLSGQPITDEKLNRSIELYNTNRRLLHDLYSERSKAPWKIPTGEVYLLQRAGFVIPVEQHNELLEKYLDLAISSDREEKDNARVILVGIFCEQPPLGLIKSLEKSGCYIVDDDFSLGARWIQNPIATSDAPLHNLSEAFLKDSAHTSSKYETEEEKGDYLIASCQQNKAEGVIFCAPSFCDPALLDQPMLVAALEKADIDYTTFKYSEDTGQFAVIREQAGTFADSIKLWSSAAV